jgi:hypothetical protein
MPFCDPTPTPLKKQKKTKKEHPLHQIRIKNKIAQSCQTVMVMAID